MKNSSIDYGIEKVNYLYKSIKYLDKRNGVTVENILTKFTLRLL